MSYFEFFCLVLTVGVEPTSPGPSDLCLYQLGYVSSGRDDRARTCDLMLPKHVFYQTELHPCLAGHKGFEPLLLDLESNVLPLTLMTYMVELTGIEPATFSVQGRRSPK